VLFGFLFIILSLLDERLSHKFKRSCRQAANAAWIRLLFDGYHYDGARYDNGHIKSSNPSVDVACVVYDKMDKRDYASFVTDSNWEQPGEAVYVIGTPMGFDLTITNGLLSSWRLHGALFQITAPVTHGSSGSPVFNAYGLLIGMITSSFTDGGEVNFAISANAIYEALGARNGGPSKRIQYRNY
jgi:S1-C subfamily serine protease